VTKQQPVVMTNTSPEQALLNTRYKCLFFCYSAYYISYFI